MRSSCPPARRGPGNKRGAKVNLRDPTCSTVVIRVKFVLDELMVEIYFKQLLQWSVLITLDNDNAVLTDL